MVKLFFQLVCIFSVGFSGFSASAASNKHVIKVKRSFFKLHYKEIHGAIGVDFAGMNMANSTVDLIVTDDGLQNLRALGLKSYVSSRELSQTSPDPKFKSPDQLVQALNDLQKKYPTISQVLELGKSLEGRDILALRITQNITQPDGAKPAVLFNGMHHAREVMSTEVPLDIAEYLLSKYGSDPQVTHWINADVVYVLPMVNPDGSNMVWTSDSMWRKNARGNYGVDINRNYPYAWNTCNGSSDQTSADDYRGPSAASEPETNVMMNFVTKIHPVFDISFHSYSELVIYPYGCGAHTESANIIEPLGQQMASLIPNDAGNGTYTAGLANDLLYLVDGDDIDWMYNQVHVIPFVIELNSDAQGFQPSYDDWREKTVTKLRPAWQLLLNKLDHASVHGMVKNLAFDHITVENASMRQDYPIHKDGSFHIVLKPGDYHFVFTDSQIRRVEKEVHVGEKRLWLEIQ